MYQFSYVEIMEDGVETARSRERQVLDRSIELLRKAQAATSYGRDTIEAVYFTRRVWIRFVEDLGNPENQLDKELRANLISIALWILGEAGRIRKRESTNFQGIIDITTIIRDGIK